MNMPVPSAPNLKKKIYIGFAFSTALVSLMLFGTAGTVSYWETWAYLVGATISSLYMVLYMLKHSPELLERRTKLIENETAQKINRGFNVYGSPLYIPSIWTG